MTDFYATRPQPLHALDQADGLRRMFAASRVRFVAVAENPHVAFSGVLLERLTAAFAAAGQHTLVVDAADASPAPHELAMIDLAACIEPLSAQVSYLAARGLPLRHVNTRGATDSFLCALIDAAPHVDLMLVHASASDLSRMFVRRAVRPVLLAADQPDSVTHAYGAMKLLARRNELMAFDLLLAASPQSPRRDRIAQQLASCADNFLGAVLHDWAAIDPACDVADAPTPALARLCEAQLRSEEEPMSDASWHPGGLYAAVLDPAQPRN
jgi:hypothetical protein